MDDDTLFNPFASEDISPPYSEHWEAKRRLAQAIRELGEAMVTSVPPVDTMHHIAEQLEQSAAELISAPRLYGQMEFHVDGDHGKRGEVNHELNALAGSSNPLAPGLNVWMEGDRAFGSVNCGWTYEGPPRHVHGGFVAAIFDQFLGTAQMMGRQPGMTGKLTTRYHSPTPLNVDLKLEGWLEKVEGRKTLMQATMHAGDTLTATCEALFIRPRHGLGLKEADPTEPKSPDQSSSDA
ncbi:MAG: PaaI family thioesterase [Pseudomonadota bacterium]